MICDKGYRHGRKKYDNKGKAGNNSSPAPHFLPGYSPGGFIEQWGKKDKKNKLGVDMQGWDPGEEADR